MTNLTVAFILITFISIIVSIFIANIFIPSSITILESFYKGKRTQKAEKLYQYLKNIESQCIRDFPNSEIRVYITPDSHFDYLRFEKNKLSRGAISLNNMYDEHFLAECANVASAIPYHLARHKEESSNLLSEKDKFVNEVLSKTIASMQVKTDSYR